MLLHRRTFHTLVGLLGFSITALFVNLTPTMAESLAQGSPNQPGMNRRSDQLMNSLNPTPEQQQQLQAIRQEYQGEMQQQQQQMRQIQQELNDLMSGNASESQIRQKHDQLMNVKQQMGQLQFDMMLKMRAVLTPEQRAQLMDLMQERRQNSRRDR